jgi:hypothetical protein
MAISTARNTLINKGHVQADGDLDIMALGGARDRHRVDLGLLNLGMLPFVL